MRRAMFTLKNGSMCPVCEKGEIKEIKKDLVFKYKSKRKRFEDETIFECDLCDNEILPREVNKRIERN